MSKRKSLSDRINTPIRGAVTAFTTQSVKDDSNDLIKKETEDSSISVNPSDSKNDIRSVTLNETEDGIENEIEHDIKIYQRNVSTIITNIDKEYETNNISNDEKKINTNNYSNNETKIDINNDANNETLNITEDKTENETENVTKNETNKTNNSSKIITSTKSIKVGNTTFKSTYYNDDDIKRAAYHLRQDTIDKIEKCSKLSGLKKAEFVDLVLNNILTDILNKIDK